MLYLWQILTCIYHQIKWNIYFSFMTVFIKIKIKKENIFCAQVLCCVVLCYLVIVCKTGVIVCVCSRKGHQSGTSVGFTPGNWAYISHRAYARLFKVAKTMQNELSIDRRGTLVVYNAPTRFTYWVPTCVWMIAGTIQMGKIKKIHTHPQLLCMHPYWASSLNFS